MRILASAKRGGDIEEEVEMRDDSQVFKESLIIRNLGPLTDVVLDDVRPILVLLGKSGSGKSLILKVLSMLRHVCKKQLIRRALKASGVTKTFRIRKDSYLKFADMENLISGSTYLEYRLEWGGQYCSITFTKRGFDADFSDFQRQDDAGPFLKIAFISDSRNLLASWARKGAGVRSQVLDNYFSETYDLWDEALSAKMFSHQEIRYLGVQLAVSKGKNGRQEVAIVNGKGHNTLFERGASGEKASIPVLIILRYLMWGFNFADAVQRSYLRDLLEAIMEDSNDALPTLPPGGKIATFDQFYLCAHVEEPELSLDPQTQLLFADDLIRNMEPVENDNRRVCASIAFTTHSPYWVTALNTIAEEGESSFLTWERLCGYLVRDDGTVLSLRDEESRVLMTPNMDKASFEIDDRYNAALDRREAQL